MLLCIHCVRCWGGACEKNTRVWGVEQGSWLKRQSSQNITVCFICVQAMLATGAERMKNICLAWGSKRARQRGRDLKNIMVCFLGVF